MYNFGLFECSRAKSVSPVLMRGHNIQFYGKIRKIISELPSVSGKLFPGE